MQTPDTKAGRLTEVVMLNVRRKLPTLKTYEYNRVYEATLEVLNSYFGVDTPVSGQFVPHDIAQKVLSGK